MTDHQNFNYEYDGVTCLLYSSVTVIKSKRDRVNLGIFRMCNYKFCTFNQESLYEMVTFRLRHLIY